MASIPIGGQQVYRPALDTATGGAYAKSYKNRKKENGPTRQRDYIPDPEAVNSLRELKRERGIF